MEIKQTEHGTQDVFVVLDQDVKATCRVTKNNSGDCEILELSSGQENGRTEYDYLLLYYVIRHYRNRCRQIVVNVNHRPWDADFYQRCGFVQIPVPVDYFMIRTWTRLMKFEFI